MSKNVSLVFALFWFGKPIIFMFHSGKKGVKVYMCKRLACEFDIFHQYVVKNQRYHARKVMFHCLITLIMKKKCKEPPMWELKFSTMVTISSLQ